MYLQNAADGLRVLDLAAHDAREHFIKRRAVQLQKFVLVRVLRAEGQPIGKVKVQHLAVAAGGDEELAEINDPGAHRAGLLLQFAYCGLARVFAAL